MARRPDPAPRAGFTLAEVAVTLLIVGMCLLYVLQGLNAAKRSALETYQEKVAREMAVLTFGRIEAGLYWEDLAGGTDYLEGTYADEGYETYAWEAVFGEETSFRTELADDEPAGAQADPERDSLAYRREQERERAREEGDEDALEAEEPFEKVGLRVLLVTESETRVLLTLERWIPWELVYGESEDEAAETGGPLQ
ncbi:MAG: prepilin-type N-terminal cleavage/methylation domain-containing protein [Planctomycetota bacterium]